MPRARSIDLAVRPPTASSTREASVMLIASVSLRKRRSFHPDNQRVPGIVDVVDGDLGQRRTVADVPAHGVAEPALGGAADQHGHEFGTDAEQPVADGERYREHAATDDDDLAV